MKLDITAYKLESGIWAFDHTHRNTKAEPLCGGTENVIDYYFTILNGRLPVVRDRIKFHIEDATFPGWNICVKKLTATTYYDFNCGIEFWLCPWLEGYFGTRPEHLYVKMD